MEVKKEVTIEEILEAYESGKEFNVNDGKIEEAD